MSREGVSNPPVSAWQIHSILVGIYPLAALFSTNVGEARLSETAVPAAMVCGLLLALHIGAKVARVTQGARAVLVTAGWIPIYGYGLWMGVAGALPNSIALVLYVLLSGGFLAAFYYWIARRIGNRRAMHRFLNVCGGIALVLAASQSAIRAYPLLKSDRTVGTVEAADEAPDIYFLIFDAYPRADVLLESFAFDNSAFLGALEDRDFFVADESRSNYIYTQMSLAATLNMDYLGEEVHEAVAADWDAAVPNLVDTIWNGGVLHEVRSRGYEIVAYETWLNAAIIPNADRHIEAPKAGLSEFQIAFINRTPLRPIVHRLFPASKRFPFFFGLEHLGNLQPRDRPMFVFLHVLAPHLPHTVDANGNVLDGQPYHGGFRNETAHINRLALRAVDAILTKTPDAVIVMQSDHGPWSDWQDPDDRAIRPWEGTREAYVEDRTAILNAIRLPGAGELYASVSPVNTFRAVFNACFGTGIPLLPDRSYVYTEDGTSYFVVESR